MEKINSVITKKTNHAILVRENIILCFLTLIILWQITTISSVKKIGFGIETGAKNAADFFLKNNLRGPIFNNFDIGSYLDYRFYAKEKVFIDGRPEAYPVEFFQKIYIPMQTDPKIFEEVSQKYKINAIFFSHTDMTPWGNTFLKQIINNKQWKMIYFDDYVVIFIKNTLENKNIIDKFLVNQRNIDIKKLPSQDETSLFRTASFFNKAAWQDQEIKTYQHILSLNPNHCPTLYNMTLILNKQSSPITFSLMRRFNNYCK